VTGVKVAVFLKDASSSEFKAPLLPEPESELTAIILKSAVYVPSGALSRIFKVNVHKFPL
jgi:hypothetical protein